MVGKTRKLSEDQPCIANGCCGTRARSHRLDLLHEYRFKLSQRLRRSSASKLREVVNHVHLVVIAEVVGHVGPRACDEARLGFESRFKPGDPREQLRAHTDLLDKPPLKLADAQSRAVSESRKPDTAALSNDAMRRGRNSIKGARPEGLTQ